MACGEEVGDRRYFLGFHRPHAVVALRLTQQAACGFVVAELIADLHRNKVRLADESAEWLCRLLPTVYPLDLPPIRDRHDDLDGHVAEAAMICAGHELGDRPQAGRQLTEQMLPVSLEERPQELPLATCLLNR